LQLQNVAHNTHCTEQNNQFLLNKTSSISKSWVRKFRYKISEMMNVHILCSNCLPPAATHTRSLFRHSATALSIMRWSSLVEWSLASRLSVGSSTVSRARCTGAPFCWNVKLSE